MRIVSHAIVVFFVLFVGFSFASFANNKTLDDAGPTNPTSTNRFPKAYSKPQEVGTPTGVTLPNPNPTSSPARETP